MRQTQTERPQKLTSSFVAGSERLLFRDLITVCGFSVESSQTTCKLEYTVYWNFGNDYQNTSGYIGNVHMGEFEMDVKGTHYMQCDLRGDAAVWVVKSGVSEITRENAWYASYDFVR